MRAHIASLQCQVGETDTVREARGERREASGERREAMEYD
jgi:hypothetical protein